MSENPQDTPSTEEIQSLLLEILAKVNEIQQAVEDGKNQDASTTFTD